ILIQSDSDLIVVLHKLLLDNRLYLMLHFEAALNGIIQSSAQLQAVLNVVERGKYRIIKQWDKKISDLIQSPSDFIIVTGLVLENLFDFLIQLGDQKIKDIFKSRDDLLYVLSS